MGALSKIAIDPVETPGIFHVDNVTQESADRVNRILRANRSNHIFTSSEKEMGVSITRNVLLRGSWLTRGLCRHIYIIMWSITL